MVLSVDWISVVVLGRELLVVGVGGEILKWLGVVGIGVVLLV